MPRAQKADGSDDTPVKKATRTHKAASKAADDAGADHREPVKRAAPAKASAPAAKAAKSTPAPSAAPTKASAAKSSKEASKTPAKASKPTKAAPQAEGDSSDEAFLAEQRELLDSERIEYVRKADELKAEADSLARETEPGDIQFDEEGGEGGTASIDREVDLVLSAQARAAVEEIDRALHKIDIGTYGICESCNQPIPRARLQALPYASLCVQCKSGGLSRR